MYVKCMVWDWVFQVCECHHKKGPGLKRVQRKIVFKKRAVFKGHSISFWGSTPEGKSVCLHFSCFQTF